MIKIRQIKLIFLFITVLTSLSSMATTKGKEKDKEVDKLFEVVLSKYRNASYAEIKLKKSVKSELLGTTKEYKSHVYLSKGKFRFETLEPEHNIIVFDGTTIWSAQYPPAELGGDIQVSKQKLNGKNKAQAPLLTILHPGKHKEKYKVVASKKENEKVVFSLSPKDPHDTFKEAAVGISMKTKKIETVSYKDEVGNETTLSFEETSFLPVISVENKKKFQFVVPKGAKVVEL